MACHFVKRLEGQLDDATVGFVAKLGVTEERAETETAIWLRLLRLRVFKNSMLLCKELVHFDLHLVVLPLYEHLGHLDNCRLLARCCIICLPFLPRTGGFKQQLGYCDKVGVDVSRFVF